MSQDCGESVSIREGNLRKSVNLMSRMMRGFAPGGRGEGLGRVSSVIPGLRYRFGKVLDFEQIEGLGINFAASWLRSSLQRELKWEALCSENFRRKLRNDE